MLINQHLDSDEDYISDLNNAINEDRIVHGKKPLKFEEDRTVTPKADKIKI